MWKNVILHEGDLVDDGNLHDISCIVSVDAASVGDLGILKRCRQGEFCGQEAICGHQEPAADRIAVGASITKHQCDCGKASVVFIAQSDRKYLACKTKKCKYFRWADTVLYPPLYKLAHELVRWECIGPPKYALCTARESDVYEKIVQGCLGDCWFLSAVGILCGNESCFHRVVPCTRFPPDKSASFCFCIDGVWQNFAVDSSVPVFSSGKRKDLAVFARPKDNISFGPLIEKAYAKAYGNYAALIGGQIAEALFDLTGCPVETLKLDPTCDLDELWSRLMSWHQHKFLIGCSTSFVSCHDDDEFGTTLGSQGLVSMHAYSVIDLMEFFDVAVGKQLTLTDMFTKQYGSEPERMERLRLVQVRNPWGRKEWRGDWGAKSEKWTRTLINHIPDYKHCEGKFWIQFEDFVRSFEDLDVAKTHKDWFSLVVETSRSPFTVSELLASEECNVMHISSPFTSCWCYITLVQPSNRSAPREGYKNLGMLLVGNGKTVHASCFGVPDRMMTIETILEPGVEYAIVVFTLGESDGRENRNVLRIFSAEQLLLKDRDMGGNNFITTASFEEMIVTGLPIRNRIAVCKGVSVDVMTTHSVAAWVVVISEDCEAAVALRARLSKPEELVLSGQWFHEIRLERGSYKTVLGIAAKKVTNDHHGGGILRKIDFDLKVEPCY